MNLESILNPTSQSDETEGEESPPKKLLDDLNESEDDDDNEVE